MPLKKAGKKCSGIGAGNSVKLRAGFSQLDWVRLTRAAKDLAGLKGAPRRAGITLEEMKMLSKAKQGPAAGWSLTAVKGIVYNVRQYLPYHPGGEKILKGVVGKDATKLFEKHHAWVSAEGMLESCIVGTLANSDMEENAESEKQNCQQDDEVETF